MHTLIKGTLAIAVLVVAPAAYAQEAGDTSAVTVSGNVSLTSQYRLRGVSQSDEDIALQGGMTVSHASGVYAGAWASSLAGFGSFGGANLELDLIAGYATSIGAATIDGGVVYYVYPGTSGTDFIDLYASVSAPVGPVTAKLGAYYAPSNRALGHEDNIWVYTDLAAPIPDTPVTLKGHIGYTDGALGGPDGDYIDYALGVDVAIRNMTLNVSYIDTDIGKGAANAFYAPGGHRIVDGAIVATLTASF